MKTFSLNKKMKFSTRAARSVLCLFFCLISSTLISIPIPWLRRVNSPSSSWKVFILFFDSQDQDSSTTEWKGKIPEEIRKIILSLRRNVLGELKKLQHLVIRIITLWSNFTLLSQLVVVAVPGFYVPLNPSHWVRVESWSVAVKRANDDIPWGEKKGGEKKATAARDHRRRRQSSTQAATDGTPKKHREREFCDREKRKRLRQEKTTDLTLFEFLHFLSPI